ncbi:26S proteasome non-ATPase regulatory subunit 10 [Obelidium mucronatum]|nr:26S proteasome non-ATPase regulatory subunit 10 [Obelidium mucronatum]
MLAPNPPRKTFGSIPMENLLQIIFQMTIPKPLSAQTIQVAAFNGALDVVKSLVDAQPSAVKSIDEDQRTALHWAASGKHINVVEYLISKGADVNAQDDVSCLSNQTQNKTNIETKAKWTPLMIAASVGAGPIADFLIINGADVNLQNENKQTPLFYAASKGWLDLGNIAIVRLLLQQANVKLDIEDKSGNSVLHVAVENGQAEIAVLLVEAGAEIDLENREKQKPLDLAPDRNVKTFLERAWVEASARNH